MSGTAIEVRGLLKQFDDFTAVNRISFSIEPGEFVTLLGPSGCGKTTMLRMLAGFIRPDDGEIYFNGKLMNDIDTSERNTAMVFQSYALFPHKSVYENIRFGLRMKKVPKEEQAKRIKEAMEMVDLIGLERRKPYELSGGQQQRVALARAIVTRPDVLLFDEPLSNLDAKLRDKVREDIRRLQRMLGITSIYVTHDQAEALSISDRIIVMNKGHMEQMDTAYGIYERPDSAFVADFVGSANLIPGMMLHCENGIAKVETDIGILEGSEFKEDMELDKRDKLGYEVRLCIRPEDIRACDQSGENVFRGRVTDQIYLGNTRDLILDVAGRSIRCTVRKTEEFETGEEYSFSVDRAFVHVLRKARR